MATPSTVQRRPGPRNPQKYPFVGNNYNIYGEQPGYIYYPWTDSYYIDPKAQQGYYEQQGVIEKRKDPSLADTLIPVAATAGTYAIAQEAGKQIPGMFGSKPANTGMGSTTTTAMTPTGGAAAPQAAGASGGNAMGMFGANAAQPSTSSSMGVNTYGPEPMPAAYNANPPPDGGMPPNAGTNYGAYAQGIGGAAQAYTGYQQYKDGKEIAGVANMAGGAYNAYAGYQAATGGAAPAYGGYVAPVVAAANIGQNIADTDGNTEDRAAASQAEAAKAAMLAVPVYGQIAYAALAAIDAVSDGEGTKQLTRGIKNVDKFNDRIDFGLGKAIRSKVFHQSTRGVQQENTGKMLRQSDDPGWQNYVQGMRAQHDDDPRDPTKPFAGKYASWDEYKAAGLQADDLTGVFGNIDAFKPDWAEKAGVADWSKLTFDQQRAVTQVLIEADLYESKKGEVVVKDKDKAREIYQQMIAGGLTNPIGAAPGVSAVPRGGTPGAALPDNVVQLQRSSTLSPGIGLDGRPISGMLGRKRR